MFIERIKCFQLLLFSHSVRFGFRISVPLQFTTIHITHTMLFFLLRYICFIFYFPIFIEPNHHINFIGFSLFSSPTLHTPNTQKHTLHRFKCLWIYLFDWSQVVFATYIVSQPYFSTFLFSCIPCYCVVVVRCHFGTKYHLRIKFRCRVY